MTSLLLDTHALFWWTVDDPRLPVRARRAIETATSVVFVSAVTVWELTNKVRLGKWAEASRLAADLEAVFEAYRFTPLPVSVDHARVAGSLAGAHRDPFDRMLAAQALMEGAVLVSGDRAFADWAVDVVW